MRSSEKEGVGWRFDTPDSGDGHPKLVWNPDPLTSHRILTHFRENYGDRTQDYIMHVIKGVQAPPVALLVRRRAAAAKGISHSAKYYITH